MCGRSHSAGTPRPTATSVAPGQVIATPLSATPTGTVSNMMGLQRQFVISRLEASVGMVSKVLLKAVGSARKDLKTFTLHNVDTISVKTQEKLKLLIRTQLQNDMLEDFDVGYLQGSTVVNIRSSEDLDEVWNDIRRGKNVVLWCDGLKEVTLKTQKRKRGVDDSEDDFNEDPDIGKTSCKKKKKVAEVRERKVDETVDKLREKHGNSFTQMQYRIWSERIVGNVHSSVDLPPNTSMFTRAGASGGGVQRKKPDSGFAESLMDFVKQLSGVLSPTSSNRPSPGTSPAKSIESRSKCYKQLSDLNSLKMSGVITKQKRMQLCHCNS